MTPEQLHASLLARYDANVIRKPVGCWGWRRRVNANPGYPKLGSGHTGRVAMHRFSYEIHRGPIPDGMHVCHTCDNKVCTNPEHLFLGENLDNARDARSKRLRVKDSCRQGHAKTPENTYVRVDRRGYAERHCRLCTQARQGYQGGARQRMSATHCGHGHDYAVFGIYTAGQRRRCRECVRLYNARRWRDGR